MSLQSDASRSGDDKLELDQLSRLSVSERHGLAMTCIKNIRIKLELLVLKSSFDDAVREIQQFSRTLRLAVLEVRQSEPLARILQGILHIGNYCKHSSCQYSFQTICLYTVSDKSALGFTVSPVKCIILTSHCCV